MASNNKEVESSDGEDFSSYSPSSSHYNEYEIIGSESSDSEWNVDEVLPNLGVLPYQFKPLPDEGERMIGTDDADIEDRAARLVDLDWCACDNCQIMERVNECRCCQEIPQVERRVAEDECVGRCITEHPGFAAICLNTYVLYVAWLQYKHQYGRDAYDGPDHKMYHHISYRQLVRWCWFFLGKNVRVILPACAVSCIRAHFPPPGHEDGFEFIGFQP